MTHTLSFTAALTSPLYVLLHTCQTLAVAIRSSSFTEAKLELNTCSVELPGRCAAMNIVPRWRIALSINIGVLENH